MGRIPLRTRGRGEEIADSDILVSIPGDAEDAAVIEECSGMADFIVAAWDGRQAPATR